MVWAPVLAIRSTRVLQTGMPTGCLARASPGSVASVAGSSAAAGDGLRVPGLFNALPRWTKVRGLRRLLRAYRARRGMPPVRPTDCARRSPSSDSSACAPDGIRSPTTKAQHPAWRARQTSRLEHHRCVTNPGS